jgi:hypothetical protein
MLFVWAIVPGFVGYSFLAGLSLFDVDVLIGLGSGIVDRKSLELKVILLMVLSVVVRGSIVAVLVLSWLVVLLGLVHLLWLI